MTDSNFSRAFEELFTDNESSAIQELVYTAIGFLEDFQDFPGDATAREQLRFTRDCFPGEALELGIPQDRKDGEEAGRLLEAADAPKLTERARLAAINRALISAPQDDEVYARALTRRGAQFLTLQDYSLAACDFCMALEAADDPEVKFRLCHKLAQCRAKVKRFPEAVSALKEALKNLEAMPGEVAVKRQHEQVLRQSLAKMCAKKKAPVAEKSIRDFAVDFAEHPDIQDVSSQIRIKESAHQGRYAVAAETITPGTVVASSAPAAAILNPDDPSSMFKHCLLCMKRCLRAPVPCPGCRYVVYCSVKCRDEDAAAHSLECRLNLYQLRQTDTGNSFRIFLTFRSVLKRPLKQLLADADNGKGFFGMVTHADRKEGDEKYKYLVLSVLLLRLLQKAEYITEHDPEELELDLLVTLHRMLQIQDVNTHPIMTLDDGDDPASSVGLVKIGNGVYPQIGSYFNHSCDPNTCRVNGSGGRTLLVATRTIPAGREVSDIYSMHYSENARELRRGWLRDHFFFDCACAACERDWPDYEALPGAVKDPGVLSRLEGVERALAAAVRKGDFGLALRLHLEDVGVLEEAVPEPHRLYVSVRNSLQFVLWKLYSQ